MNSNDFVNILGNIAHSLASVQKLISGLGYLLGILFIIQGIMKFKQVGESNSKEGMMGALTFIFIGAVLLFLPSSITVLSNTAFGVGNILQYSSSNRYDVYGSMGILIQTAGLIWFVRGCVLLVHSGDSGAETEGAKGLTFIVAGILAMNFAESYAILNYTMNQLLNLSNMGGHSSGTPPPHS